MNSLLQGHVSTEAPSAATEPFFLTTEPLNVSAVPQDVPNQALNASIEVWTVSNEDFNISTEALAMDTEAGPISTEAVGLSSPASLLPDQLIADDTHKMVKFVLQCGLMPLIAVIGFVGNAVAINVLLRTRRQMKLSIYTYISALTIVDTMYLAEVVLRAVPLALQRFNVPLNGEVLGYFNQYSFAASIILPTTSVYILILLSVERLLAIWKPLRVNQTLIARYPVSFVASIVAVVTCITLPLVVSFETRLTVDSNNVTEYASGVRDTTMPFFGGYLVVVSLCFGYLPFLLICPLNIAIAVQYRRVLERRKRTFNDAQTMSRRDTKLVATVLQIMTVFTICKILDIVSSTLYAVDDDFKMEGKYNKVTSILFDISDLFIVINNASDFVIYNLMSSKYKDLFIGRFCAGCRTSL